jgi:hypothetical protein
MRAKNHNQSESIWDVDAAISIYPSSLTRKETEKVIEMERLHLYNRLKPCGAAALRKHLIARGMSNPPSVSSIGKILAKKCLTNGRTGYYPGDYQ